MSDANDCVAPWLGLPELPAMNRSGPSGEDETGRARWKGLTDADFAALDLWLRTGVPARDDR